MSRWLLTFDDAAPDAPAAGLREALCALGNGRFATRAAAPEAAADGTNYPGTYFAGCFNRLTSVVAGREVVNEDMVNLPNWLPTTFRIADGDWFAPGAPFEVNEQRWELDMRRGVLTRLARVRDAEGRETRLTQRRLVSMADPTLAALETTLLPLNWSGRLTVRSALDGRVANAGVARYRDLNATHLSALGAGTDPPDATWLDTETTASGIRIAVAARTGCQLPHQSTFAAAEDGAWVGHELLFEAAEGEPVTVAKTASVRTSRDTAISDCLTQARLDAARAPDFDTLLSRHELRWSQLWRRCAIDVDDTDIQRILNLHIFHLLQTLSPHTGDLDAGVPARGLHGEAYRGHIFWDELFVFPFLTMHFPATARATLRYRWRRLPEARAAAAAAGHPGAMFPWQSGSDGREETQTLHLNPDSGRWLADRSHRQRHVGIAIAYDVWKYYQFTGDAEFLAAYGAELLLDIARFLSGLATYNRALDRYEIRGVMGPDEYHDGYPGSDEGGLDNNAYTNVMTAWVLSRALDTQALLPPRRRRELEERLGLGPADTDRFEDVSRKLVVPFHDGVISQFAGYEKLEELDWGHYRAAYPSIQRLDRILEAESGAGAANRYKASKQADTLMLFFLLSAEELAELLNRLGYEYDTELIPRTVEYYLARTSHGSTLSSVVHAWVLSRTDRASSWRFFTEALCSDIDDSQGGTTAEGIHLGAMAGTLDLLTRCYTGLTADAGALRLNPRLPDEVKRLAFSIRYHGHWDVRIEAVPGRVRVELPASASAPIRVEVAGESAVVSPGSACDLSCAC